MKRKTTKIAKKRGGWKRKSQEQKDKEDLELRQDHEKNKWAEDKGDVTL